MALLAQRDHAVILSGLTPAWPGIVSTAAQSRLVIMAFSVLIIKLCVQRSGCRTCKWLTIRGVSHLLTFHTNFLGGEGEGNVGGGAELCWCGDHDITEVTRTNFELDIFEAKRVLSVACGICIFTGLKQEIECDPNAVHGSLVTCRVTSKFCSAKENLHVNRFHPGWRVINLFPCGIHSGESKVLLPSMV